jgi:hypothetical protein
LCRFASIPIPEILPKKTNWNSELAACTSMHTHTHTHTQSEDLVDEFCTQFKDLVLSDEI